MKKIRYAIADDHEIFRQGLRSVLAADEQLELIGEAANGTGLLALLENTPADVALVDLKMPDMDGMQVLEEINRRFPETRVIMLTMFDDEHFILHLIENGARGYLIKNANPQEIITAIHNVHRSGYHLNDLVSMTLLRKIAHKAKVDLKLNETIKLNDNELQVLHLVCQEHTTAEISEMLFLSPRTVEGIRSGMLEKIGVRNTAGLVLYAVRKGLIK